MSTEEKFDLIFKALADSRRRAILDLLRDGPRTTGELCSEFENSLDRCTVMQHLGVLEKAGLIFTKKEGRQRWNYLNAVPIREIYDRWISGYAGPSVAILSTLRKEIESELTINAEGRF